MMIADDGVTYCENGVFLDGNRVIPHLGCERAKVFVDLFDNYVWVFSREK